MKHETCGYLRVGERSHGIQTAEAAAMSLIVLNTNLYPSICHTMLLAVLVSSDVLVILEQLSNVGTVSRIFKPDRVYVLLTAARNRDDSGVVSSALRNIVFVRLRTSFLVQFIRYYVLLLLHAIF